MASASKLRPYGFGIGPGREFPEGVSQFDIELACTRDDRPDNRFTLSRGEHMCNALRLAYPDMAITSYVEKQCELWYEDEAIKVMIGHMSSGKSYVMARIAMLDFLVDPFNTAVVCTSVSVPSLRQRLWSDVVSAFKSFHGRADTGEAPLSLPLKYTSSNMRITNPAASADIEKVGFTGVATDNTEKAVGKIQGLKMPRMRILVDEGEATDESIFEALPNLVGGNDDVKAAFMGNPKDKYSAFGTWWEPVDGFSSISVEDEKWKGKRKTTVLHFDGLKSPALENPELKGLLKKEGIQKVIDSFGDDSVGYWMFVRGFPPPDGSWGKIMNQTIIDRCRDRLRLAPGTTFTAAALDPAFGGQDSPALLRATCGMVIGKDKLGFNLEEIIDIKFKVGVAETIDEQLAAQVLAKLKEWGVVPENFIMDTSGRGYSIQTLLRASPLFGVNFHAIDFSGAPTGMTILDADDANSKANQKYDRFVTELWYSLGEYMGHGLVGGMMLKFSQLLQDLNSREYTLVGKKIKSETKQEMKKRIRRSPDHGDACCLIAHLLRIKGGRPGDFKDFFKKKRELHSKSQALQLSWNRDCSYGGGFYDNFG